MFSTILLILLLIAFIIYVYKYPPSSSASKNSICMDYSKEPMSELNLDLIHTMVDGYRRRQLASIKNAPLNPVQDDAHSIWFGLETLKKFIYHIEYNAKKVKNPVSSKELGLRIYYSNYPESSTWGTNKNQYPDLADLKGNSITAKYSHLHTLVAIPTMRRKGVDYDFNPTDEDTFTMPLNHPESPYLNNITPKTSGLTVTKASNNNNNNPSGAQNHGSLIPPADGSGEGF